MQRANEDGRHWLRSERVFNVGSQWFFQTRERIDVGPYPSRDVAADEAARLARVHRRAAPKSAR